MFFETKGARSRDGEGVIHQRKVWWVMRYAAYLDSIINTLMGRGNLGFPSTRTTVERSLNTHQPGDQKISLLFLDGDHPERLIWGTELKVSDARNLAAALLMLAEEFDPMYSTAAFRDELKQELNRQEEHENEQLDS